MDSDGLAAGPDLPAARTTAGLLRDRAFGPYVASKLVSVIGLWVYNLVAALWAYELTGSTVIVGLVSVAVFGPQLVFAVWSGIAADRGDRLRRIVLGRLICACASGGLASFVALAQPSDSTAARALLVASLAMGCGLTIGGPAMQAIVPTMVRSSEVAKAVTIDSIPMLLGLSLGPLLGALIAAVAGPAAAFATAAGAQIVFALVVARLRVPRKDLPDLDLDLDMDQGLGGGFRFVRNDRVAALVLIAIATAGFGADPAITLTPAVSQLLRGDDSLVGILASSFGLGAALGALSLVQVRRWLPAPETTALGLLIMGLGALAAALSGLPSLTVGAFFVDGVGMAWVTTSATVILQLRTPDALRGRVMAIWIVAFVGARPLAGVIHGTVAELVSTPASLVAAAAAALLVAGLCRPGRLT
ncbi:MAG TPA: MFS transporter [Nocardioidaceae bacterium]|nr:MFS transporter [Nocardioidaceae bacterium]